jgi:hypothetical protein
LRILINGLAADNRQVADRWADIVSKNKVLFVTSQRMLKFRSYKKGRLSEWKM